MVSVNRQAVITTVSVVIAAALALIQIKESLSKPSPDIKVSYVFYDYVLPPGVSEISRSLAKDVDLSDLLDANKEVQVTDEEFRVFNMLANSYVRRLAKPLIDRPAELLVFTIENKGEKAAAGVTLVTRQRGTVYISGRIEYKETDGRNGVVIGDVAPRELLKVYFWTDSYLSRLGEFYVAHQDGTEDAVELIPLGGIYKAVYEHSMLLLYLVVLIPFSYLIVRVNIWAWSKKTEEPTVADATPAKRRRRRKRKPQEPLPPSDA
ncbi:hypothetical protein [Metapseudomonas otitidis]|uniref:hypothetical protein n=1 Tax=Metapseudomonas otitidis TaxID=319939 RepID=UPI001AB005F3|nr:hypothetical protein [Pseudomonas otitidis]MBO2927238.1 hypothetical protein [Pseudomonas otitidis]